MIMFSHIMGMCLHICNVFSDIVIRLSDIANMVSDVAYKLSHMPNMVSNIEDMVSHIPFCQFQLIFPSISYRLEADQPAEDAYKHPSPAR